MEQKSRQRTAKDWEILCNLLYELIEKNMRDKLKSYFLKPVKDSVLSSSCTTLFKQTKWPIIDNFSFKKKISQKIIGREDTLNDLIKYFDEKKTNDQTVVKVIHGPTGSGKSQLVSDYSAKCRSNYKIIWECQAGERDILLENIRQLARKINKKIDEEHLSCKQIKVRNRENVDILKAVKKRLSKISNWLLILNNTRDEEVICDVIPPSTLKYAHVIIVSQNSYWPSYISTEKLYIGPLLLEHAVELLERNIKINKETGALESFTPNELKQAKDLAVALKCLPLPLIQAGKNIYNDDEMSIADFTREIKKKPMTVPSALVREDLGACAGNIANASELNFEKIGTLSKLAQNLFKYCAYLSVDEIPKFLLSELILKIDMSMDLDLYLTQLEKFNLIEIVPQSNFIRVPRLNGAQQRNKQTDEENFTILSNLINVCAKLCSDRNVIVGERNRRMLLRHWIALLRKTIELHSTNTQDKKQLTADLLASCYLNMAMIYYDDGESIKARCFAEEARDAYYDRGGNGKPSDDSSDKSGNELLANIFNILSLANGDLGDLAFKKEYLDKALTIKKQYYAENHWKILSLKRNQAIHLSLTGELEKAKNMCKDILKIQRLSHDADAFEMHLTYTCLANIYADLGELEKQQENLKLALTMINMFPYNKISQQNIAAMYDNLAVVCWHLGDIQNAEHYFEMLKKYQSKRFLFGYAWYLYSKKRYEEALSVLSDMTKKLYGGMMTYCEYDKNWLDKTLQDEFQGKEPLQLRMYYNALYFTVRCCEILRKKDEGLIAIEKLTNEAHDWDNWLGYRLLGKIYQGQGQMEKAESYFTLAKLKVDSQDSSDEILSNEANAQCML